MVQQIVCCRLRSLMCFSFGHHNFLLIEHEICFLVS